MVPVMLATALGVVALVAAIVGAVRGIGSLGLIAGAIAIILSAAVIGLNGTNARLAEELTANRLAMARSERPPMAASAAAGTAGAAVAAAAAVKASEPEDTAPEKAAGETETSGVTEPETSGDTEPDAAAVNPAAEGDTETTDAGADALAPLATTIRTPAGDLEALELGDTSDLADPDTGLLGERYFVVTLEARVAAARRHLRPLALVLVDAVTDASATAAPVDPNLAADVIRETLRDADTLCRLQSGKFAILLEDTPENGAIWTVERIRRRLGEQLDDVTVWAGIACYPANGFDGPEVLDRAREALVQAREWRQDRTEVADT